MAGGDGHSCRVLIGMQRRPQDDLRVLFSSSGDIDDLDQGKAVALKRAIVMDFRKQLTVGAPTNRDEQALKQLSAHLKAGKVCVKLFLHYPLHAKLYLLHRNDPQNPRLGIVGSSNLTLAGLRGNGELNVDVLDHDATEKLSNWFTDRWNDQWCLDITKELIFVDQATDLGVHVGNVGWEIGRVVAALDGGGFIIRVAGDRLEWGVGVDHGVV